MTTGPVEKAILADIEALGQLHHGQATLAAVAIGLAQQFDRLMDEKISRELRLVWADLQTSVRRAKPVAPPVEKPVDSIDELKARRHKREAGEAGA